MSGIIRIRRKENPLLPLDEKLFVRMVKAGFNTRRKTLRNALSPLGLAFTEAHQEILTKRAEQLSVSDWILFSNSLAKP
jgi:16S rRNA (adenine1518-N6/adenine1519-N6)-dimethyltransferase